MNTSVENAIKERFVSFYKAMNDWYLYCNSLDKDETLTYFEKTNKQKEEIKVIFDRYCTKGKERMDSQILYHMRFFLLKMTFPK